MNKLVIGCDPDSDKSGFAFYVDKRLDDIKCLDLLGFYRDLDSFLFHFKSEDIELHIENLNGISSNAFSVRSRDPIPVKLKKAEHVGKCKQVQIEIERIANHFGVKVVHHAVSSKWKDAAGKKQFEQVTGWTGRSNADNRSAAYFGFLGCK